MAEPADSTPDTIEIDGEVVSEVRRLPVSAEALALEPPRAATVPAAAAAAAGGFALGVAAVFLLRVLRRPAAARSLARRRGRMVGGGRISEIASTHSFLVDVHVLKR